MPAVYASLAGQDWNAFLNTLAGLTRAVELEAAVARLKQCSRQDDWVAMVRAAQKSNLTADVAHLNTADPGAAPTRLCG